MTKKLSLYLAFLALLAIGIYVGMQTFVSHEAKRVVWKTVTVKDPPSLPALNTDKLISQPTLTGNKVVVPSPEGNQFAVLSKANTLTILDAQSGRVVSQTVSSHPMQDVTWISERLLFFMTSNNLLFTFDVQSRKVRLIHSFQVPGKSFQTIAFSPYTNDIFVMFANKTSNTVYQFDTNEHDYLRNLGNIPILRAYYGATNLTLYIESTNHTLYQLKHGVISRLRRHAAILKGAGNDLYYANLNDRNQVVSVGKYDAGGSVHKICSLPTPASIDHVVVDHAGHVFASYPHELRDATQNRQWGVPTGFNIRVVGNQILLMKGDRYRVVVN